MFRFTQEPSSGSSLLHRVLHTRTTGWYAAMTWPRHKRRGYRTITVVLSKHKNGSLMMVPAWIETCRSDRRIFNCFNIPVILWLCASLWNNKSALILLMHGTNMKNTGNVVHLYWEGAQFESRSQHESSHNCIILCSPSVCPPKQRLYVYFK
jgi:hypothetical protein